jgi:SAM-dependent methyltransferase
MPVLTTNVPTYLPDAVLARAVERYRGGTCRDRIVHDLILADAARLGERLTFLDVGCGKGFDTDVPLQQSLVRSAGNYVGIEPDRSIELGDSIKDVRRCFFEEADLPGASVHVAFAIMVLEHLADPQPFWDKLYDVLVPGGVFWAMTVDARHWFCRASIWLEHLKLKEWYLSWLMGTRGSERYENYPVYYRCNTPEQVARRAKAFSSVQTLNLSRMGQADELFPRFLRPLSRRLEARAIRRGRPGTLLLVRAGK